MAQKKKLNVAEAYKELEELAAWFERGEPDLDAGMEKFSRAHELATALQARLQETEHLIHTIRTKQV